MVTGSVSKVPTIYLCHVFILYECTELVNSMPSVGTNYQHNIGLRIVFW